MHLKLLLPYQVLIDDNSVASVVIESSAGAYGLLPQRLDCIASLVPSVLSFITKKEEEIFVAIDEGVLVKTGPQVLISVRNATIGKDLDELYSLVQNQFLAVDEQSKQVREVMAKLESGFIDRFMQYQK